MPGALAPSESFPEHIVMSILFNVAAVALLSVSTADAPQTGALDRMLRLAAIGTEFKAFVEAHPEAKRGDADRRDEPVSMEEPVDLLIVHEADPFLGLHAFANIGFREGRIYEMVSVWTGEPEPVEARRKRFFAAAVHRHGHVYTRETILVFPNTPEERPVAVLCWQDKTSVVLAFYTKTSPLAATQRASLTYALFTPDDPFLADILSRNPADEEQRKTAWAEIEDVLQALDVDR